MLETGEIINGRYEITGFIDKGGMSKVYRARDIVSNADLAIKVAINKEGDAHTAMLGLSVEGNLLKRLSNPHLPKIYDVVENGDDIMIVMDYVEGQSLDKVLAQTGPVPAENVIEWGIQICDVFHYLHTQNPPVIYRDMKPANVVVQPDGNIMMIDFGTARRWKVDANRTSDTMLIGTEGFAAPEQFGGRGQSDARTDIFCLGATMFNLVTNHSPYIKPFGITPLGDWNIALKDSKLDRIIQKCTANDPYERYQTAYELKLALIDAKEAPGKTGLFGKNKVNSKGKTKRTDDWQPPPIKVSKGESRKLGQQNVNKKINEPSWQSPAELPVQQQSDAGTGIDQKKDADRAFTWKLFMLVGMISGIVLIALAVLLILSSPPAGVIMAALAMAIEAFGVFSALKYSKLQ